MNIAQNKLVVDVTLPLIVLSLYFKIEKTNHANLFFGLGKRPGLAFGGWLVYFAFEAFNFFNRFEVVERDLFLHEFWKEEEGRAILLDCYDEQNHRWSADDQETMLQVEIFDTLDEKEVEFEKVIKKH